MIRIVDGELSVDLFFLAEESLLHQVIELVNDLVILEMSTCLRVLVALLVLFVEHGEVFLVKFLSLARDAGIILLNSDISKNLIC